VHFNMCAGVQPCLTVHQHAAVRDVDDLQLAPRTQADAGERLLPIGHPARRAPTLATTGVG
jgi:hypothetical protein